MENEILYETNQSQDVVNLQCKYTLFKRVMNILTSATTKKDIDVKLLTDAFNKVIERNDCLRIKFVKKGKKLMQYFQKEIKLGNIPYLEFATKEDQENFFLSYRKKTLKYMKGQTFEVHFCKTYDDKFMVIFKVCHLILDAYGINNIYKDLFEVYDALKNGTELPSMPTKYEDVLKKDIVRKNDKAYSDANTEFFTNYFNNKPTPYYAGLHGSKLPLWQKQLKKGHKAMKMFFINNQTDSALHPINANLVGKAIEYSKANSCSLANVLMYAYTLCSALINDNIKNLIQLELSNCRATLTERKCGGTKAQSLACYVTFDYERSFAENFATFTADQEMVYRHIGFSDIEFEMLMHKIYKKPLLETYYASTFSLIPYSSPEGVDIQIHSNGRFVLPSYIALMYNIDTNEINMAYDFQTKITTQQDIESFHKNYVSVLEQVMENPSIKLKDIKVDY